MKARKRFGQHFLEQSWVTKLVSAIEAGPRDAFLEIGPGRGAITRPLAGQCAKLLAVEVDRDLAAELEAGKPANVTVVTGDFLKVDILPQVTAWLGSPPGPANQFRIVGNLPYNISSPILFRLLDLSAASGSLRDATLMLQKEVADRLLARTGTGEYGVLTVLTTLHADVTRILTLPPGAFRPPPKVHSAVVRLTFRPPKLALASPEVFVGMVRSVFTQRRKMLGNALKNYAGTADDTAGEVLSAAGIDPRRRPETLTLQEFARLANTLASRSAAAGVGPVSPKSRRDEGGPVSPKSRRDEGGPVSPKSRRDEGG